MSTTYTLTPTSTATSPASLPSASSNNGGLGGVSWAVLIPIFAVVGTITLCIVFVSSYVEEAEGQYSNRRRFTHLFRDNHLPLTPTSTQTLTAAELLAVSSTNPSRSTIQVNNEGDGTQNGQTGSRGQRRRRGVRRTDSGVSIRTLPAYSKEAGDEEVVLVRRTSMGSLAEDSESDDSDIENPRMPTTTSLPAAITVERNDTIRSSPGSPVISLPGRPDPMSPGSDRDVPPNSAPIGGADRSDSTSRREFGEAPSYLEAMSSPYLPDLEAGVPPPRALRPPTLRERTSSTFRNIFHRAGLSTGEDSMERHTRSRSTSLLLEPQSSRMSVISSGSGSPGHTSPLLHISSPVPNSAVRASIDLSTLPRAGLSDDQMRFFASDEARSQLGVNLSDAPAGKSRRRSDATLMDDLGHRRLRSGSPATTPDEPPSFEEAQLAPTRSTSPDRQCFWAVETDTCAPSNPAPAPTNSADHSPAPILSIEPPTPITNSLQTEYFPHGTPGAGPARART